MHHMISGWSELVASAKRQRTLKSLDSRWTTFLIPKWRASSRTFHGKKKLWNQCACVRSNRSSGPIQNLASKFISFHFQVEWNSNNETMRYDFYKCANAFVTHRECAETTGRFILCILFSLNWKMRATKVARNPEIRSVVHETRLAYLDATINLLFPFFVTHNTTRQTTHADRNPEFTKRMQCCGVGTNIIYLGRLARNANNQSTWASLIVHTWFFFSYFLCRFFVVSALWCLHLLCHPTSLVECSFFVVPLLYLIIIVILFPRYIYHLRRWRWRQRRWRRLLLFSCVAPYTHVDHLKP